jgi:hypothetical protein
MGEGRSDGVERALAAFKEEPHIGRYPRRRNGHRSRLMFDDAKVGCVTPSHIDEEWSGRALEQNPDAGLSRVILEA